LSQYAGVVDEAVQVPEFLLDTVDQRCIRITVGSRKVEHRDRWSGRVLQIGNLVVNAFKFLCITAVQHNLCTQTGDMHGKRLADTVTGACDHDDSVLEDAIGILVGSRISNQSFVIYCSVLSPVSSSLSLPDSTIDLGNDSSGSICSISFFGWMPSSTNLRAPGRTLRSSEPTARL